MIKFFRQIRFNLMEQNKTARYIKYAIGEIVLVVIGILIALSINNWNEGRKGRILELQYLEGIKTDLESDLPHVENRLRAILRKLSILRKIDTIYINTGSIETHDVSLDGGRLVDGRRLVQIFNRGGFTRLTTSTYNALTTNTAAGLLKNTELLNSIQELYEIKYPATQSIYEDIKRREEFVGWKYAKEFSTSNIQDFFIDNPNKEEALADFNFYYRQQGLLYLTTQENRDLIVKLIEDINTELEQRQ